MVFTVALMFGSPESTFQLQLLVINLCKPSSTRASFHVDKFPLTSFICSCGREKMAGFTLTNCLVEKLACYLFNKKPCQGKLGIFLRPHEQIKLENLSM